MAETRVTQARTEAVRRELSQSAANARDWAEAVESAIRKLGGFPGVIGPFLEAPSRRSSRPRADLCLMRGDRSRRAGFYFEATAPPRERHDQLSAA